MAFQIKDFSSIAASMINLSRSIQNKITDFNVGSKMRTLLEASAAELDELYQQMLIGLREAIPVAVYSSFNFELLPAVPASGLVTVTIASSDTPIVITAGTIFAPSSGGTTYASIGNITIQPTITVASVPVAATASGVSSNLPASTTFTLNPPPTGFVSATNAAPFINGADDEKEDERKIRFNAYIQTLSKGTVPAIKYGLKTTFLTDAQGNQIERVVYANVVEPWVTDILQPISLVNGYIHNGIGSTSSPLVDRATQIIYGYYDENNKPISGYKAAGVKVVIAAATETAVNVTGTIVAQTGFDVVVLIAQAAQDVRLYLQKLDIGQKSVKSELIALIMNIPGVYNVTLSAPASDTTAAANIKLMPGTIALTAA